MGKVTPQTIIVTMPSVSCAAGQMVKRYLGSSIGAASSLICTNSV